MKYRTKLTLFNYALSAVVLGVIGLLYYAVTQNRITREKTSSLIRRTDYLYGSITEISDVRLKEMREGHSHFFVYFYAPWCKHCVEFLEEYNAIAESITREVHIRNKKLFTTNFQYDEVSFMFLNCENFSATCRDSDFNIQSYPTLLAFNFRYKETLKRSSLWSALRQEQVQVTVPAISSFVSQHHFTPHSSPFLYETAALITELSDSELVSVIESARPMVVLFYVQWCTHCQKFVDQFQQIAESFAASHAKLRPLPSMPHSNEMPEEQQSGGVLFAAINCEEFRDTCFGHDLPVHYYPTVIAFNMNPEEPVEVVDKRRVEEYLHDHVLLPIASSAPSSTLVLPPQHLSAR